MKEVIISKGPSAKIIDSPIPAAGPGQVTVKVKVAAANPKDWKLSEWIPERALNEGEDLAGTVHAVGEDVVGFAIGDRVAALHSNGNPGGAYAEYAVANARFTFHIPPKMSFEEASTIPLGLMTAALGMYKILDLPTPWQPRGEKSSPLPLLVTGGSTAVGAFAIKLAALANIHPIITTAGAGMAFVESLLDRSQGDVCLDYRDTNANLPGKILAAIPEDDSLHVLDGVGNGEALIPILKLLGGRKGKIALSLPFQSEDSGPEEDSLRNAGVIPSTAVQDSVVWGTAKPDYATFGAVITRYTELALFDGVLQGHPFSVRQGGLEGVQQMLLDLKAGMASATKFVVRVA